MGAKLRNYKTNAKLVHGSWFIVNGSASLFFIIQPPFSHEPLTINYQLSTSCLTFASQKEGIMSNRTFTMIKPDAFSKGYSGAIIDMIIKDGFRIVALKLTKLSAEKAGEFYAIHKARPFYGELV